MDAIKGRFGLSTDQGTNALAFLLAVFEFAKASVPGERAEVFSYALVAAGIAVLWLTRGHAAGAAAVVPDAVQEDEPFSQKLGLVGSAASTPRRINGAGLLLIKSFEGCRLTAYKCPAGVWTIGYGHTGRDVVQGLRISQDTADDLLRADLRKFEAGVAAMVSQAATSDNEFAALVSLSFNCGLGALSKSSVLACHVRGQKQAAGQAFLKWVRGGGRVLPGLVRRREAEKKLYLS